MSVYILYTVGTRDLLVEGSPIPLSEQRSKGKEFLDDFDSYKDKFSAPQLEAAINYILQQQPCVNELHLFVTDQPKEIAWNFSDTVFIGDILKKYLSLKFSSNQLSSIKVRRIENINVTYYDEVYQWFSQKLTESRTGDNLFYLSPAAGTPAVTLGLLLHGIRRFQTQCRVLYHPMGEKPPIEVRFPHLFLLDLHKEVVKQFLHNYDYAATARLLRETPQINWIMPEISWIAATVTSATHRLYFDFATARDALQEQAIPNASGEIRQKLIFMRNQLNQLINDAKQLNKAFAQTATLNLLEELFHNAYITFLRGQYVDFLGRLFRFHEAVCRYLVELYYKLPTNALSQRADFIQGVEQNHDLVNYLSNKNIDYHAMNIPTFLSMISYLIEPNSKTASLLSPKNKETIADIYKLLSQIQKLASWRNKCIISHGWEGINKEQLLNEYGVDPQDKPLAPVEDMRQILKLLGKSLDQNPFDNINSLVIPFFKT